MIQPLLFFPLSHSSFAVEAVILLLLIHEAIPLMAAIGLFSLLNSGDQRYLHLRSDGAFI